MRGDVTDAGQTNEQLKIELLSQWKLESRNKSKDPNGGIIWAPLKLVKCILHEIYCMRYIAQCILHETYCILQCREEEKRPGGVYLGAIRAGKMCLQPAER